MFVEAVSRNLKYKLMRKGHTKLEDKSREENVRKKERQEQRREDKSRGRRTKLRKPGLIVESLCIGNEAQIELIRAGFKLKAIAFLA